MCSLMKVNTIYLDQIVQEKYIAKCESSYEISPLGLVVKDCSNIVNVPEGSRLENCINFRMIVLIALIFSPRTLHFNMSSEESLVP